VRVRFTTSARTQFLSHIAYIRSDNRSAAARFRKRAEKTLKRLETFPDSGRRLPEFPDLPHREIIVPPYRFFYRVVEDTVWIVGVWHGVQLPDEPH